MPGSKDSHPQEDEGSGKDDARPPQHQRSPTDARREDEQQDDDAASISAAPPAQPSQRKPAGRPRKGRATAPRSAGSLPRLPALSRSRSDLRLDLIHLASRPPCNPPPPQRARADDDVGFVPPSARLRASLSSLARYELFRASANRSKERSFDARKKVLSWLTDGAIRTLAQPQLMGQRLALPLLWATLQSRYHEEADDGRIAAAAASGGGGAGGGALFKSPRARRSSSFEADAGAANGLAALFRHGGAVSAQSASPASPLSPAPPASPLAGIAAFNASSPSVTSTAASASLSPFRSHLTMLAQPVDPLLPHGEPTGSEQASPVLAGSGGGAAKAASAAVATRSAAPLHSPSAALSGGSSAASAAGGWRGGGARASPAHSAQQRAAGAKGGEAMWESVVSGAAGGALGHGAINRYATVRLPSSAHGISNAGQRSALSAPPRLASAQTDRACAPH